MQFQVTAIEFDFELEDDLFLNLEEQQIIEDILGEIWEADDEEDLIEEITCSAGWCIKSIDYRHVLK